MAGLTAQERQLRNKKRIDRLEIFTLVHAVVTVGLVIVTLGIIGG